MLHLAALLVLCLGVMQTYGHFLLNYPATVGFDDETEGTAPCGGSKAPFTNATDFHVDGDAVALTSTHPSALWTFRGTLDTTASGNWTDIFSEPIFQSALGDFCEPQVKVPSSWAGHAGILQITQHATDGALYQCALINFIGGAASSLPHSCKNATGLTAVYTATSITTEAATNTRAPTTASTSRASPSTATAQSDAAAATCLSGFLLWVTASIIGSAAAMGL